MTPSPFLAWVSVQLKCETEELTSARLGDAFTIFVCRVEEAARRHADDPLTVVQNSASGGNSRAATRRMLAHLGYTRTQLRVVHRLLGGSPSGWPGLLTMYVARQDLTRDERTYARRQLRAILRSAGDQDRSGAIAS